MEEKADCSPLLNELGLSPFQQRFPWLGGDLQTLRDTFISENLPQGKSVPIQIPVPALPNGAYSSGHLLALLDLPEDSYSLKGLVLLLHGLGGSSKRLGLRRMGFSLLRAGFAVLRLNLRGADPGRNLAGGSYAAQCNSDLEPVLRRARELSEELGRQVVNSTGSLPLFGAGISLGGTILLNACFGTSDSQKTYKPVLDGLVCTSSPLDLEICSASIERPRNRFYQKWLLKRLVQQTIVDPFGISESEKELLFDVTKGTPLALTIREFDSAITASRWGYKDVDDYYSKASPLHNILKNGFKLPPTLLLQALDDPWVPAGTACDLALNKKYSDLSNLNIIITKNGGHNGFHGINGCWGDRLVESWFEKLISNLNSN